MSTIEIVIQCGGLISEGTLPEHFASDHYL